MTPTRTNDLPLGVTDVRFSYGANRAVDGVTFSVGRGEIFGLLGPNGAGKTTTISMIAGLARPESGSVLLFGKEASDASGRARARLGVVPQEIALYEELTVGENTRFWGQVYGLRGDALSRACEQTLRQVGLDDRVRERVAKLSGGLKRRLNLAVAMVHGPDLLILDEPTVGIDPQARLRILDVVRDQAAQGRAVLYTSHYLEEAEQICDRIGIIDHGRLLAEGTVEQLRRLVGEGPVVRLLGELVPASLTALAQRLEGVALLSADERQASFSARDPEACAALVRELFGSGIKVEDLRVQEPSLQSLFLKLTGRELRD